MLITTFTSKATKGLLPLSPYDDLTFDFKTYSVNNLKSMFRIMVNNFTLNIPINKDLRTFRRKTSLKQYCNDFYDYIILDIGDVKNNSNKIEILKYFKKYNCIIGESRSCNNVDNFNMKGILQIKSVNYTNFKLLIQNIQDDLKNFCFVDNAVTRIASYSAPLGRFNVVLESNGQPYQFVYRPNYHSSSLNKILDGDFSIPKVDASEVNSLEDFCLKTFLEMKFEPLKQNGKCIIFKHPSEVKSSGGYFWFKDSPFIMHHYNAQKSINIFQDVRKNSDAKKFFNKNIDYKKNFSTHKLNYEILTISEQVITSDKKINTIINNFIGRKDGVFTIKSPMGTGKSNLIHQIVQESVEQDLRILICTNRISIAEEFKKQYPDFKIYNRDKYKLNESLIVQFDSLWKYDIRNFDIIILDEFISLLLHSRNSLGNSSQNFLKFFASFKKKLVIADAFLTGYENIFLSDKKSNLYLINNDYRDSTSLYEYKDYNYFFFSVLSHAKKERVSISSTSINVIYALYRMLSNYNLKVAVLTSETPKIVKDYIYKEFEKTDNFDYDVIIFSPTLTVGISNMNNIYYHFHYDGSSSCDVISSLQMIKRIRKAKEIHFYVKNKINYLKTTYKEIYDEYMMNLDNNTTLNHLFYVTDYGDLRLSKYGIYAIYIDLFKNILEYNHKHAFCHLLPYQFSSQPQIVLKSYESNILLPYIKKVKTDKDDFTKKCIADYIGNELVTNDIIQQFEKFFFYDKLNQDEIKTILNCMSKDEKFIEKIKNFNIFYNKKIKNKIAEKIKNGESKDVKMLNDMMSLEYKDKFSFSEVSNTVKNVLLACGYCKVIEDGLYCYKVKDEILKFKDFVNED